ncbi:MAG: hypothetical protein ACT4P9_06060 [Betaproteobacteria bacterium]
MSFVALLLAALVVLATPAWAQPLATFPLEPEIALAEKPHFFGSSQGLAGVFGALGGIAVSSSVEDSKDRIKQYMDKHAIDIRQIVLAEFRRVAATASAPALPKEGVPYRLRLGIPSYGISARGPFADEYKPWLRVRLEVLDKAGRAEFDEGAFVNNRTDGTPVHALAKYFGDPEVLRAALTRAAELAVAEVVKDLAERYGGAPGSPRGDGLR